MADNVYMLQASSTMTAKKLIIPTYYLTEEAAEQARECLWADGEITPQSVIKKIPICSNPPEYKGVILKAELLRPEHELDEWHVGDRSLIIPISYEDYARLRYPDAKDEFQEQELMDADSAEDLKGWLPYKNEENDKSYFYCYFPDKLFKFARHSRGNLVALMSDAYKDYMESYRNQVIGIPIFKAGVITDTVPHKDFRDEYPQILMVKLNYPGTKAKSSMFRRDIINWDLSAVWDWSRIVWDLDSKKSDSEGILLDDGIVAKASLSYLFNVEDSLPLVVFGRYEVFVFVRVNASCNEHTERSFVKDVIDTAWKTGKLRKVG